VDGSLLRQLQLLHSARALRVGLICQDLADSMMAINDITGACCRPQSQPPKPQAQPALSWKMCSALAETLLSTVDCVERLTEQLVGACSIEACPVTHGVLLRQHQRQPTSRRSALTSSFCVLPYCHVQLDSHSAMSRCHLIKVLTILFHCQMSCYVAT
jgi:hypothetical protein